MAPRIIISRRTNSVRVTGKRSATSSEQPSNGELEMNSALPPITLSSLDVERIERLLEDPAFKDFPGREQIETDIWRATVADPKDVPQGVVTMNSRVRFVDEDNGRGHELELVSPRDASGEGRVSVFAPVGSA